MKKRCLNAACECHCNDDFCSPSCQQDSDLNGMDSADCSCEHAECALDKVPLADEEPDNV